MSKCYHHTFRQFDIWLEETFDRAKDISHQNNHQNLKIEKKEEKKSIKRRQTENQKSTSMKNGRTILRKVIQNTTKATKSTRLQNSSKKQITWIRPKGKTKCAGDYCLSNDPQTTPDDNQSDLVSIPYRVRDIKKVL